MKPLFLAALSASLLVPAVACENCSNGAAKVAPAMAKLPAGVKMTTLSAPKMHCAGCAQGIKTTLAKQPGVQSVVADAKTKLVVVTYISARQNPKMLAAALTKAGWPAQEVKEVKAAAKTGAAQTGGARAIAAPACEMCEKAKA